MESNNKSNDIEEMMDYMLKKVSRIEVSNTDIMKLMLQIVKNQEIIMNAMGLNKQQVINNENTTQNDLPGDYIK